MLIVNKTSGRTKEILKDINTTFEELEFSPSDQNRVRKRAFNKFDFVDGNIQISQSQRYWSTANNKFEKLPSLPSTRAVKKFILEFLRGHNLTNYNFEIDTHQHRNINPPSTICEISIGDKVHQDGYDYLAIICVSKSGFNEAKNQVYKDQNGKELVQEYILNPGDYSLHDDKKYWHKVSPSSNSSHKNEHRDVLILGLNKL